MQLRSQGFSSLVFFISILTGCGGGGGGGGGSNATTGGGSGAPVGGGGSSSSLLDNISGKTEAQFIQIADQLAENVYSGATTQSSVSAVSIQPLVRLLLLGEGELVGDITGALAKTADPSAEATGLPSLVAARKIDVNDSQSCENSDGSILLSGSVNDQGIGAVNLSFNNCILGGVTADGDGAVYLQDASGIDFMFAWDSVSFTLGGITETASGKSVV